MKNIYFSNLLEEKFPKSFAIIISVLNKYNISFEFIKNTKDIWCRDYMPIKAAENKYIQFKYEPTYLKDYEDIKTNPLLLHKQLNINPIISDINIDGGNIVKYKDKVIMTDKVFKENPKFEKDELIEKIKFILEINELIIIPKQPYDMFGHSDSMVRFIDDNTVLINDFSIESVKYIEQLYNALEKFNLNIVQMTYSKSFLNKYKWGAYLNFVEVGNVLLMPVYGTDEDKYAIDFFSAVFPEKIIEPVKIPQIIKKGGAMHCISWIK